MTQTMRGWLTAINPLVKLAATLPPLILVFFTRDVATPASITVLALVVLLSGLRIRARTLLVGALAVLIVGAWTALLFALLVRPELVSSTPIVFDGWVTLRAGALEIGTATALRLIAVSMLALLGSAGTTIAGLSSALVRQLRIPYRFAHGALAAARFAPRYRDDLVTLRAAHRARGIIDPRGPVGFLRRSSRSAIPLLAGGARYAERLSLAMDARGFGAHPTRTDRHPVLMRRRDVVFLILFWLLLAAVFAVMAVLGLARWSGNIYGYTGA
ncbi:energy-coupling factor transporter transmembrane protein EcfT [Gulosibacter sp. 10]|uniref:energy-coupling factor transporter transmembrane component T family protein n=1 Tax=Gulosibacter sp. 10 TaxID=1255570 RepID=UPI00097F52AD|nr:energy-coupling factor transporter transmembrane component T [Gulosibacter sp. 10]SJM58130.1 Transmembrane component YkoC of energizing module of thiamin-regulated ECF transporter for HydroxyMethylPyrimidine [Gulosibacter sp. 10]